jgi:hypothetical protein
LEPAMAESDVERMKTCTTPESVLPGAKDSAGYELVSPSLGVASATVAVLPAPVLTSAGSLLRAGRQPAR